MQMKRQVGSAFKPLFGAALESRRYTLGTILNDSIHLGREVLQAENYSGRYVGNISLRRR